MALKTMTILKAEKDVQSGSMVKSYVRGTSRIDFSASGRWAIPFCFSWCPPYSSPLRSDASSRGSLWVGMLFSPVVLTYSNCPRVVAGGRGAGRSQRCRFLVPSQFSQKA
jgi:hypothetical protein